MTESSRSDLPLVSIIMAAYNAESYIKEAIRSVLNQSYLNFELLIINDGSTDSTEENILCFTDLRIKYIKQKNRGVSSARNEGLRRMTGDFFCFLDADDAFLPDSMKSRMELFGRPDIDFVDGKVLKMNDDMTKIKSEWYPNFVGKPLNDLIQLSGRSFFGPTWLIRRDKSKVYEFHVGLSHCEDLLFFMNLARTGGDYAFVEVPILFYRDTVGSAMKNLRGLEKGYRFLEKEIKKWPEISLKNIIAFKFKWRQFMALDYIRLREIKKIVGLMN